MAFFRLNFLENMAIYLCLLRVNIKIVSGNKKEIRINQKRPKEVSLKHYFFYDNLKISFFLPFWAKILRNMLKYMCLLGVIRKTVSGNKKKDYLECIKEGQIRSNLNYKYFL